MSTRATLGLVQLHVIYPYGTVQFDCEAPEKSQLHASASPDGGHLHALLRDFWVLYSVSRIARRGHVIAAISNPT